MRVPDRLRRIFIDPAGIRPFWRLAIFAVVVAATTLASDRAKIALIHAIPHDKTSALDPVTLTIRKLGDFAPLIIAGFVMGRIEKRRVGDYGLAFRPGFARRFGEGVGYGLAGVSLVIAVASLAGAARFASPALNGGDVAWWAGWFALGFLAVALMEEYSFRGYALFTLSTWVGFWPAALVIAALFGYSHVDNAGETALGVVNVAAFFVVFCFVLRRTGDLWLGIGFHMAWNWAEAFLYGMPDSGVVAPAHVFAVSTDGAALWTGGSAGPEATVMDLVVLALIAVVVRWRYPVIRYSHEPGHRSAPAA